MGTISRALIPVTRVCVSMGDTAVQQRDVKGISYSVPFKFEPVPL